MSIVVDKLSFSYGEHRVLNEVSFLADYGEFVSVIGPNGVGKTTLFRCILGLNKPDGGCIRIEEKDISEMEPKELARKIAYIPQSHNPVFNYSVFDMVLMGTTAQMGRTTSPGKIQREMASQAMELLGITDIQNRGFRYISGGERQLVLIARAIAQQAKIMVMDEPTASLDFGNRIQVMKTVRKLVDGGYTVIQSTHDPNQAYMYSDKVLALDEGTVAMYGPPDEVINSELITKLYGVDVEVCNLRNDKVRVCIPLTK